MYRWAPGELPNDGSVTPEELAERKSRGYFKIYRDLYQTDIADNLHLLTLFIWLLNISNWGPSKARFGGKYRDIKPGECITGFRKLSEDLNISVNTVRKHLRYLEDTGRIKTESDTRGTLISICKWDEYQSHDKETYTNRDIRVDTQGDTRRDTRRDTTIEEVKNLKRKEVCVPAEIFEKTKECIEDWKATLKHFGVDRNLIAGEDAQITRGIQRFGPEAVQLAIRGAQKQSRGAKFNPAEFLSLAIILSEKNIARLGALGAGASAESSGVDWSKIKLEGGDS